MQQTSTSRLSEWVELHTAELYSWALHKVSDPELAGDLVQDTFLAAAEKVSAFKGNSTPKTWLFSILNNKIIDHYRKKARQPVHLDNQIFSEVFDQGGDWKKEKRPADWHEEESNLLDDEEFQQILKKCMDELPERWNACVKLKYLMNKNGEEICQDLDITPTNFWQIIHRAKLQLRNCVETNWFSIL